MEMPTATRASGTMDRPLAFRPPVDCCWPESLTSPSAISCDRFWYTVGRLRPRSRARLCLEQKPLVSYI